jgi:hypothetical protein
MKLPIAVEREAGTAKAVKHEGRCSLLLSKNGRRETKHQQDQRGPSIPMRKTSLHPRIAGSFFS